MKESPEENANTVDPDQTLRSVASDLGFHCLPMSFLWAARHFKPVSYWSTQCAIIFG